MMPFLIMADMFDVIVVGGGHAGCGARRRARAARARAARAPPLHERAAAAIHERSVGAPPVTGVLMCGGVIAISFIVKRQRRLVVGRRRYGLA